MKVKLTKVYREENLLGGLRNSSVIGESQSMPVIGNTFCMISEPLESGNIRVIETSPVKDVNVLGNIHTITTESNSIYTVEIL